MVKGFKKKNSKGGHDFIPTEKKTTRNAGDVDVEVDVNVKELDDFAKDKKDDFENIVDESKMTFKEFIGSGRYLEDEIRKRAEKHGSHFFDPDTMRFFSSRISELMWSEGDKKDYENEPIYFITSEADKSSFKHSGSIRAFTIRKISVDGDVDTIGKFQGYSTLNDARHGIMDLINSND